MLFSTVRRYFALTGFGASLIEEILAPIFVVPSKIAPFFTTSAGVSIVPKTSRPAELNTVAIPVHTPKCFRTFGLSWARGRYLPQRTLAFRDFLVDALQRRERNGRVKTA